MSTPSNTTEGASLITSSVVNNNSTWELYRYTGSAINGATLYTYPSQIKVGTTHQFSGFMYSSVPGQNGPIKWYVKNSDGTATDKATIGETSGVLTALKPGEVKIWYKYDGLTYYWVITVTICYIEDGVYRMYSHSDTETTRRMAKVEKTGIGKKVQQLNKTFNPTTTNIDRYCLYKITTLPDGSVSIRTMLRSKIGLSYETVSGANLIRTADIDYYDDNTVADKNKWVISGNATTGYLLKNKYTNTYMAFSSTNQDGASLTLTTSTSNNSKWRFVPYTGSHMEGGAVCLTPNNSSLIHIMNIGDTLNIASTVKELSFYSSRIRYNKPTATGLTIKNLSLQATTAASISGTNLTALKPGTVSLYMTFENGYLSNPLNFYIQTPSSGEYFYMQNIQDNIGYVQANSTNALKQNFNAAETQIWQRIPASSGYYYIRNVGTGLYLKSPLSTSSNVPIEMTSTPSGDLCEWKFTSTSSGAWKIQSKNDHLANRNLYLNIQSTTNPVLVQREYVYNSSFFDEFNVIMISGETVYFKTVLNRKLIDPSETIKSLAKYYDSFTPMHSTIQASLNQVTNLIDNSKVMIMHGHASPTVITINEHNWTYLRNTYIYDPSNPGAALDLSDIDIIIFAGCGAGGNICNGDKNSPDYCCPTYDTNGNIHNCNKLGCSCCGYNMPKSAEMAGAKVAIGWHVTQWDNNNDDWINRFFGYMNSTDPTTGNLYTAQKALDKANSDTSFADVNKSLLYGTNPNFRLN